MIPTEEQIKSLKQNILHHLEIIYETVELKKSLVTVAEEIIMLMSLDKHMETVSHHQNHWDEKDVTMITYGDSIIEDGVKPLHTLATFLQSRVNDFINSVHILPFFPYSTDEGFSVTDFFPSMNHLVTGKTYKQ